MDNTIKIPNHLGIIMDGNRRWAKNNGKLRKEGHLEGSKTLKKMTKIIFEKGIKYLSVYAFSTENFKRSEDEVNNLMNLFVNLFKKEKNHFVKNNIKVIFSGRKERLPENVIKVMRDLEKTTENNDAGVLNICLNYGGQYEILDMVKKVAIKVKNNNIKIEDIDLQTIEDNLYNEIPEVDLLIRTSGEFRTSGFMLYKIAYSEFYFTDIHWPDFDEIELDKALSEYSKRERRFGGTNK